MLSHLVEFGIYPSANVNNLESIRFGIRPVRPSLYVFVQTVYFTFHVNQTMYASTCNGATFRKTDHNPQHVSATFCDSWHFLISRFPLVQISSMNWGVSYTKHICHKPLVYDFVFLLFVTGHTHKRWNSFVDISEVNRQAIYRTFFMKVYIANISGLAALARKIIFLRFSTHTHTHTNFFSAYH